VVVSGQRRPADRPRRDLVGDDPAVRVVERLLERTQRWAFSVDVTLDEVRAARSVEGSRTRGVFMLHRHRPWRSSQGFGKNVTCFARIVGATCGARRHLA
jgi:hypothetical protein